MENERRRHPRFSYKGNAVLDLRNANPCRAQMVDLSAEGCQLQFESPQSIEHDAQMLMMFEIDNIPFAVRAQAKSIRSATNVGMYFPEMTENGRADLQGAIDLMKQFAPQLVGESTMRGAAATSTH